MKFSDIFKRKPTKPAVLSLCDVTGNMVKPWLEAGHPCTIVDILHKPGFTTDGLLTRVGMSVQDFFVYLRTHRDVRFSIMFSFPPCTDLAVSGAKHFARKGPQARAEALSVVYTCHEIGEYLHVPYMLENPVSVIASEWRKPDFYWDPDFYAGWNPEDHWADAYRKKTCLWTGNDFKLPGNNQKGHPDRFRFMKPVPSTQGSKMHRMGPSADRAYQRSITPLGFAYAVYEANSPWIA